MKKILFIEDESALQKTFGDILSREGYEMISALDGQTGLRLVREKKPDLVLLDLILPEMQGLDVLKKIKEDPQIKEIPVIILTNLEDMESVERALTLGAMTYLVKSSYDLKEVVQKIKTTVGE